MDRKVISAKNEYKQQIKKPIYVGYFDDYGSFEIVWVFERYYPIDKTFIVADFLSPGTHNGETKDDFVQRQIKIRQVEGKHLTVFRKDELRDITG